MKKLLLSLLTLVVGTSASYANEESFKFADLGYSNAAVVSSVEGANVTLALAQGSGSNAPTYYNTGTGIRFYVGCTLTVTTSDGFYLQKVEFTNASGYELGANSTVDSGTWSSTNQTWTAADNATKKLVLTIASDRSSSKQTRTQVIKVTYAAAEAVDPSKAPAELSFSEKEITVTKGEAFTAPSLNNPNNLAVTYSSSKPEVATVDQNGAVEIIGAGTTTITAKSAETEKYAAGSASYTLNVIGNTANIAEFLKAADTANNTTITGEVTVTYQNGNYLFVQDATGYLEVYGKVNKTYANGTKLSGIAGKYSEYNKMPQLVPDVATFTDGTPGAAVAPAKVAAADVELSQYVQLTDVKITENGGKFYVDGLQLYDQFKISGLEIKEAEKATVTGIGGTYNTTKELFVTSIVYVEEAQPTLGAITLNGQTVSDGVAYEFVEGTALTIAAENAETLLVAINDETVDEELVDSYTWTPAEIGTYEITVMAEGCGSDAEATFTVTITEKPTEVSYEGYNYVKVTSASELVDGGKYVLISEPFKISTVQYGTYLMAGIKSSNKGFDAIELSSTADAPLAAYDLSEISGYTELTLQTSDTEGEWYLTSTIESALKYLNGSAKSTLNWNDTKSSIAISLNENGNAIITTGKDGSKDITIQFYGQNASGKAGNQTFNAYSSAQHPIFLYKRVTVAAPEILVDGEPVDLDGNYDLNEKTVTITLTAPQGHHIYHKHVKSDAPAAVIAREAEANDFTHVENNVAEVKISENGTFHFYAENQATGLKSATQTLTFVGASTSIAEISVEGESVEFFDLQGRRVANPAKGGVYILKQGSKVSKRVL